MSGKSKRKVTFAPIGLVTKTVDLSREIEPFDFTFEIPYQAKLRKIFSKLDKCVMDSFERIQSAFSKAAIEETENVVNEISNQDSMNFEEIAIEVCAECVKSWTLDEACNKSNMMRINPQSVISAMFVLILREIAERKN